MLALSNNKLISHTHLINPIFFHVLIPYINQNLHDELINESNEVGKLINFMILNPQKFGVKKD